jgi:ABC-type transport system involved in multi-copper enzyme maturation permease subunit
VSMGLGLVLGVRGVVGKELRSRTRGFWRPMLLQTFYLGLVTLAVVAVLGLSVSTTGTISPSLGLSLFIALASGSVLLIAFIAPGLTSGTVSGERERRTLDLLLVTRASPLGLVAGKLAGALLWVLYLLIASLPALGIVNLFGGVPMSIAVAALCVIAATAITYTALGLMFSALLRRTVLATVLSYAVVLATVIVLPIVNASLSLAQFYVSAPRTPGAAYGAMFSSSSSAPPFGLPPWPAWIGFLSPVNALISALGSSLSPFGTPGLGRVGAFSTYTLRPTIGGATPELVTSFAPWVYYCLLSLLFAGVVMLLAALALRPVPLWREWRRRGR